MKLTHCVAVVALALLAAPALAVVPPPEPDVAPIIALDLGNDTDWNRVDDRLDTRLREARRRGIPEDLQEMVPVETIFTRQIRQQEIDAFLALGGEIDHVFQAVSYGWTGRIPLSVVEQAARGLGDELVVIQTEVLGELYLQEASSQTGSRRTWAGSPAGVTANRGRATHRLAILDSGIDTTHTDLSGRQAFWKDYVTPANATASDVNGHGTHVAAIALGSGASQGGSNGTGMTLRYTVGRNMTNVPAGNVFPTAIALRTGRVYGLEQRGTWPVATSAMISWMGRNTGTFGLFGRLSAPVPVFSGYSVTGTTYTPSVDFTLAPYLPQNDPPNLTTYSQFMTITNYHLPNDGFPAYSGIAPLAQWVGMKVGNDEGGVSDLWVGQALDDVVAQRINLSIRAANLSLGFGSNPVPALITKVNTTAINGVLPVIAAGNSGGGTLIGDLGSASGAFTVGAVNMANELTNYTQRGSTTFELAKDYKPDIVAPGGSIFFSQILAADSNNGDAGTLTLADQQANDLTPLMGTSMAAPMVAGAAMLVIDALERGGHVWSNNSSSSAMLVKGILNATATETNRAREVGSGNSPSLQRAGTSAPIPYPGKDPFEGFGSLNVDAAVQAVENVLTFQFYFDLPILTNDAKGPRAWAGNFQMEAYHTYAFSMLSAPGQDYDLYLYNWTPDVMGNPVLLASSTSAAIGAGEFLRYSPTQNGRAILVMKCISGPAPDLNAGLLFVIRPPFGVEQVSSTFTPGPHPLGLTGKFAGIGTQIPIDVRFNTNDFAIAPGTSLQLNSAVGAMAVYDSKPGDNVARFLYTVQEGHSASPLTYANLDALGPLASITIPSGSVAIPPTVPLPAFGTANELAASEILVSGIRPTVESITLLDPTTTDLNQVRFRVQVDNNLVAGLEDLSLNATPGLGASITNTEGISCGFLCMLTYDVTVTMANPNANGTVALVVGTNNRDWIFLNPMAASTQSSAYTINNPFPGDNCANPVVVTNNGDYPFDTTNSLSSDPCFAQARAVWFRHTAAEAGTVRVELCGSSFDTYLTIFSANACPVQCSSLIVQNNNSCGLQSVVEFPVTAGQEFYICVAGSNGSDFGAGVMSFLFTPTPALLGDVNVDGVVNVADVTALARWLASDRENPIGLADVNNDGVVDQADIQALADMIVD